MAVDDKVTRFGAAERADVMLASAAPEAYATKKTHVILPQPVIAVYAPQTPT
jgi:hypothetical protein